ncbi:MAG TPA: hypothetical protein VGK19_06120 [Capsulimonadaceae bacterium]|jgi:hypothetical protein
MSECDVVLYITSRTEARFSNDLQDDFRVVVAAFTLRSCGYNYRYAEHRCYAAANGSAQETPK